MLGYIACLIIGGCSGMFITALLVAAKNGDQQGRPELKPKEPYYKCKTNVNRQCDDTCCKLCFGASECSWACEGEPSTCGMSVETDQVKP
jgi:hypothetical protein